MEEFLRVGLATSAESAVRQDVLVDKSYLASASIKVCYDLTASTKWLPGASGAGVPIADWLLMKNARFDLFQVACVVEHPTYLGCGHDLNRLARHA